MPSTWHPLTKRETFEHAEETLRLLLYKVGSYIGEDIIRGKVWSLDGKYQIGTITNVYADSTGKLAQTADELIVDLQVTNPAVLRVLKSHMLIFIDREIGTIRVVQAE